MRTDLIHRPLILLTLALFFGSGGAAQEQVPSESTLKAPPRVALFDLRDVRLLDGPFKHAMEMDQAYILELKPDRLLSRCREEAGLTPRDSTYGGWEREGLSSHFVGHYLSACALQFRATADRRFLERIEYVVNELASCQQANGDGYVSGIPHGKRAFAEVAAGDIRSRGFDLNGMWSPWYTIHKIMAGLRDAYLLSGVGRAKEVLVGMSDWAYKITKDLTDEQFQKMLDCEFGGMNEVLTDVYVMTGVSRYLGLAERFYHRSVMDPLAREEDHLQGLHGNTTIPKLIGAARLYEVTGDERFATMSRFFWETVTRNHTYAAGGHGENEYFGAPGRLSDRLSEGTMETCNTYNMLKLTRFLFTRAPKPEYADYYERALYNHILASQNPDDGMVCYFVPLGAGTHKVYSTRYDDFTCCLGTGLENHSRYGECIYFHAHDTLFVNLFISSELEWKDRGLRIRQETAFPNVGSTRFAFSCGTPVTATLKIRHPVWATGDVRVSVNGTPLVTDGRPGTFITVRREWTSGDVLEVSFPMALHLEPTPDNAHRAALLYGPILLAGDLGPIDQDVALPALLTNDRPVEQWVRKLAGDTLGFETRGVGRPTDVALRPFYRLHNRRYTVYWDMYSEQTWERHLRETRAEEARQKDLENRTVDFVRLGEIEPERDHHFQGQKTTSGEYRERKWRQAADGGWFSFDLQVHADEPMALVATYWGSDGGKREFDILVDGQRVGTQVLERMKPDQFVDVQYRLPSALTQGKERVNVRFAPHHTMTAGKVFACRMVRLNE